MYKCFLFTLEAFEFRFRGMTNMIYFYAFIHSFIRVYIIHKYISLVIVNITCDAMLKPYTRYLFIHLSGCLSTRVYLCAWCEMCKSCKLIGFKRKWRTRNCGEKKREKVYAILIVYSSSAVLHTHISTKFEIRVECVRFYRLQIKYFHQCLLGSINMQSHSAISPNHQYGCVRAQKRVCVWQRWWIQSIFVFIILIIAERSYHLTEFSPVDYVTVWMRQKTMSASWLKSVI